jgi:hypothetical protein
MQASRRLLRPRLSDAGFSSLKEAPIPVTVLSGWVGAGKANLLRQILTSEHGRRIALIRNESTDFDSDEQVFIAKNGCICCAARSSTKDTLGALRKTGQPIEHIVVEVPGSVSPVPTIHAFAANEIATLEAVLTIVDCSKLGSQHLHDPTFTDFREQVECADRLLLNNMDLVDAKIKASVKAMLCKLNPNAEIMEARLHNINKIFNLGPILESEGGGSSRESLYREGADTNQLTEIGATGFVTTGWRTWKGAGKRHPQNCLCCIGPPDTAFEDAQGNVIVSLSTRDAPCIVHLIHVFFARHLAFTVSLRQRQNVSSACARITLTQ